MFVESALVHGGLMSAMHIVYDTSRLFQFLPELWRLLTPFLLTGPDFSFVFDLYLSKLKYDQVLFPCANVIQRIHTPRDWS